MTTATTGRPSTATSTGSSLEIGEPTTRAERRAAEKAAQRTGSKTAKQARAARKAAAKVPNPYKTGDHVRYDTVYDGQPVSYTGGKVIKAPGRDVVVEFASGIDFRLDHRDPGLTKTRLI